LTGRERDGSYGIPLLTEGELIPARIYIVEGGWHRAIDEFDGENIFEGATEGPAEGIR
jgi:hypothetical protein